MDVGKSATGGDGIRIQDQKAAAAPHKIINVNRTGAKVL
jgi:hypothetical protein